MEILLVVILGVFWVLGVLCAWAMACTVAD